MGECLIIRTGGGADTSDANATAAQVVTGYTCYVNDVLVTGSMVNNGAVTSTLNAGGSYTIPAGYHDGLGKVSVNSLSSHTSANAGAANVLSGYTGWVNGSKITGTMTNRGAVSQALAANGSYTIPAGWHNGSGKVTQSLTTQAAANITPGTANKTACAASRWTTGNIVILGSSSLTAGNIKKGVSIFGVTGTFTGWVDTNLYLIQNGKSTGVTTYEISIDAYQPSSRYTAPSWTNTGSAIRFQNMHAAGSSVDSNKQWTHGWICLKWFNGLYKNSERSFAFGFDFDCSFTMVGRWYWIEMMVGVDDYYGRYAASSGKYNTSGDIESLYTCVRKNSNGSSQSATANGSGSISYTLPDNSTSWLYKLPADQLDFCCWFRSITRDSSYSSYNSYSYDGRIDLKNLWVIRN